MHKNRLKLWSTKLHLLTWLVSISSLIVHNLSALSLRKGSNGVSNIELQALLKREYNCSLYDNNLCSIVHQHSANDKEKSMTSQPLRFVRRRRQNSIVNNSSSSQKWIVIRAAGTYGDFLDGKKRLSKVPKSDFKINFQCEKPYYFFSPTKIFF